MKIKMELNVCLTLWTILIATSGKEILAQQQAFRKQPSDTEVKLGDTAILVCEVDNQAGKAQWTKDGFALGFNRSIPWNPRYSVTGKERDGVNNLQIRNVTADDIGEFQCQIGPTKSHDPIRADAKLNVLVPPRIVSIVNYNASITVREKDATELECTVEKSRPAATIIWYRNNVVLRTESREDFTDEVDVNDGRVTLKMNTTRSKIRFIPTSEDDRAKYTCEARHPALTTPKRTSVKLRVLYPPGAPRIEGYNEGDTIRVNQEVTLTCLSRGGNPLADVIWYRKGERIDSNYKSTEYESFNELKFRATTKDNLVRYKCEASNSLSRHPKIADIVLTVKFPPKEVKIKGPKEARVGENVSLSCATANSNPGADIAWFKGGLNLHPPHTTTLSSPDGGYTTESNVTFQIEQSDMTVVVTCQGINRDLGESAVATHTIHVIQPPGPPRIYLSDPEISEGEVQEITCTSTGGHPTASLNWYRGGKKVKSKYTKDGNMATAKLTFIANSTDNRLKYRCEAKNKALKSPLKETVQFTVFFAPTSLKIKTHPKVMKEGQKGYLTCETGSSNPVAAVTWWRNGESIPPQTNSSKRGDFGGFVSVSTLKLDVKAEHDGAVYKCQAYNREVGRSENEAVTLEVSYPPVFIESPGEKISVVENEGLQISVKAKGNPSTISYKWSRDSAKLESQSHLKMNGSLLNFTKIDREDSGKYKCTASNKEGSSSFTMDIDVQYPASVKMSSEWIMVGQGQDAQLECIIDANPLEESMVQWSHEDAERMDKIKSRAKETYRDGKAYLTISSVEIEDAGYYSCNVDNGISAEPMVNSSIFLIVKHKPEIDLSPQIAKGASDKGETGKLMCRAKGAPNVTFTWTREGSIISPSYKYNIIHSQVDLMTWETTLEVKDVSSQDYGPYECIARNELDTVKHDVKLEVTSAPDPPSGLQVLAFDHESVNLSWVAGFNGGYDPWFKIRYAKVDSRNHRYIDVDPSNATSFIVRPLASGTEYSFSVQAINERGASNYSDIIHQETSKIGPDPYQSINGGGGAGNGKGRFNFKSSQVVISVFILLGASMLLINVFLIACFFKRRSKKRLTAVEYHVSKMLDRNADLTKIIVVSVSVVGTILILINVFIVSFLVHKRRPSKKNKQEAVSEQGSSKSATIEMYAPSSYNETVNGETLSSVSEKSTTYSHPENHDEYIDDGKTNGTYSVEQINHHGGGFPYRGDLRASTLPRHPTGIHHHHVQHSNHHEDDTYVDALRRNAYGTGLGEKPAIYGRTTPRASTRPQVPPIPELYNIPPEARYVPCPPGFGGTPIMENGTLRFNMSHSASHSTLNSHSPNLTTPMSTNNNNNNSNLLSSSSTSFQPNGRLIAPGLIASSSTNGPMSPGARSSVLSTFAPNSHSSPNSSGLEHEGHLV